MYQTILEKFYRRNRAAFCGDAFLMDKQQGLIRYRGSEEAVTIPYGTKCIHGGAFSGCQNIREIIIPDTVEEIAVYAFSHCQNLETLICGFGLTEIPMGLCSDLKELKTVVFTNQIHWIDNNAFYNCRNLETPFVIQRTFRKPITAEEKGLAFEALVVGLPEGVEELTVTTFQISPVNTAYSAFTGCPLLYPHNAEQEEAAMVQDAEEVSTMERPEKVPAVEELEIIPAVKELEEESTSQEPEDIHAVESEAPVPEMMASDSNQETTSGCTGTEELLIPGYTLCNDGILHCRTGQRIPDCIIMDKDLSPISIILFRRAGTLYSDNITLSQVLKLRQHQLSKLRRVTAKQIEAAVTEFTQLLESFLMSIPAGETVQEETSTVQTLKEKQTAESEDTLSELPAIPLISSTAEQATPASSPVLEAIFDNEKFQPLLIQGYTLEGDAIQECSTGRQIADRSISDLDIEDISILLFRKAGSLYDDSITLSQVLKIQPEQLNAVRNATPNQKEMAIAQLIQLLESLFTPQPVASEDILKSGPIAVVISPEGEGQPENDLEAVAADPLCPAGQTEEATEPETDVVSQDSQVTLLRSLLIPGYTLEDDHILSESGDHFPNLPIQELDISTRAARTLVRAHIKTLGELLLMSEKDLLAVQGMGQTSVSEIKKELAIHFSPVDGRKDSENAKEQKKISRHSLLIPGYTLEGEYILSKSGRRISNRHVQVLQLSVRATNSLLNGKIHTIWDLLILDEDALYAIRNTGRTTVEELKKKVTEYLSLTDQNPVSEETCEAEPVLESTDNDGELQFPYLDPLVSVLAPEYAFVDGIIYVRNTGGIIADRDISCLDLSVRPGRCLANAGIEKISQLINLPFTKLKRIPNMGTLSMNEVSEKLDQFLSTQTPVDSATAEAQLQFNVIHARINDYLCGHEFDIVTIQQIIRALPEFMEEDISKVLVQLTEQGELCMVPQGYRKRHTNVLEYIKNTSNIDDRSKDVVLRRAAGETLEQIGMTYGMTRERARQLEQKVFLNLSRKKILFEEDRYQYLFSTYEIEKESLEELTDITWYYLNARYAPGKLPAEKALEDQSLSVALRRSLDQWIHRNTILVNGTYIPKQRSDIEDHILENYCKDEVHVDDFFSLYEEFLQQYTLTDEALQLNESIKRTRANRLSEAQNVLWKPYQRLRWYDIDAGNYEELLAVLNLGQYQNIEISSRKLFLNQPELMQHYDIRDEYELHNLLKKIHAEKDNPTMAFGRMPNIQFGTFDRDEAVRSMLNALSPVTGDVLAEALCAEYGHKKETIMSSWLSCISANYHHGVYTANNIEMPPNHAKLLKAQLTEDFYSFDEVSSIYRQTVANADVSSLTPYNLRKMGFLVGTSYVLQHHPTADAYFRSLLSARDVFDITPINRRFDRLSTYRLIEKEMRRNREIIEFEPGQFINIRRLRKLGITQEMLQSYCNHVWSFYPEEKFFSIASLRQDGFESELDALGFDELFYVSLLRESDHFSWQKVGGCIILGPPGQGFSTRDFLVDLVVRAGSMDLDDLVHLLQDRYHVALSRIDVLTETKGSGLYYDKIMDRLYADYDTYFEEI